MFKKENPIFLPLLFAVCSFLTQKKASCQVINKFSGWFSVSQNIPLKNKFSIQFDNQFKQMQIGKMQSP